MEGLLRPQLKGSEPGGGEAGVQTRVDRTLRRSPPRFRTHPPEQEHLAAGDRWVLLPGPASPKQWGL